MRALSAIGFVISIIGLLLVFYNQFAVIPFLNDLNGIGMKSNEYTIVLTHRYQDQQNTISILCILLGVFSVIFCTLLYLRKRTRMTLFGTLIGFVVTVMAIIHSF